VVALLAVVILAACGVRGQDEPTRIDPADVPFQLVGRHGDGTSARTAPGRVTLYFLGADRLVKRTRSVDGAPTPRRALLALLAGPLPADRGVGTSSALASPDAARLDDVRDGTAHVTLTNGFQNSAASDQPAALAEIVYTLTAFADVDRATFSIDGVPTAVPRVDGSLTDGPVTRADYATALVHLDS
jgi:spore germination protein GerM